MILAASFVVKTAFAVCDLVVEEEVIVVKAPEPPNITLLGPKRIEINQYEVYKVCGAVKLAGCVFCSVGEIQGR